MTEPPARRRTWHLEATRRELALHAAAAAVGVAALVLSFSAHGWARAGLTVAAGLLLLVPAVAVVGLVLIGTFVGALECSVGERPGPGEWTALLALATGLGAVVGAEAPGFGPVELLTGPLLVALAAPMARGGGIRTWCAVGLAWVGVSAAGVGAALLFA